MNSMGSNKMSWLSAGQLYKNTMQQSIYVFCGCVFEPSWNQAANFLDREVAAQKAVSEHDGSAHPLQPLADGCQVQEVGPGLDNHLYWSYPQLPCPPSKRPRALAQPPVPPLAATAVSLRSRSVSKLGQHLGSLSGCRADTQPLVGFFDYRPAA